MDTYMPGEYANENKYSLIREKSFNTEYLLEKDLINSHLVNLSAKLIHVEIVSGQCLNVQQN